MTDANEIQTRGGMLFRIIAQKPPVFCLVLPIVFAIFVGVGFTREDYVEDSVGEIWIPNTDILVKNSKYFESIGVKDFTSTSFAAMAISRDGGNLFREDRLEEIRKRMEDIENLTVRIDALKLIANADLLTHSSTFHTLFRDNRLRTTI